MITVNSQLKPKLALQIYRLVQPQPQATGLTMLEVLVAMLIAFAFLTATLNAMVVSAAMQVKAERQAQATYWIQQDLENIQAQAGAQATNADGNTSTNECSSTFSTSYAGILQSSLGASTTTTRTLLGRTYTMTRVAGGSNTNPQILTLNYTVSNANDPTTLASLYTEIIPPKALAC